MKRIILFDPAISSSNKGDEIISDSARNELDIIQQGFCIDVATHLPLSWYYMRWFNNCDYRFVLGSNLLKSTLMGLTNQWAITLSTKRFAKNSILMGVGWWQYQRRISLYTRHLLRYVLSKEYEHSVRDSYTQDMLKTIGIQSINTGCPTLWRLTEPYCKEINPYKKDKVVFTLTDYNKNPAKDRELVKQLKDAYSQIFFWPQGYNDMLYLKKIVGSVEFISIIAPSLDAYDYFLENNEVDYIGTRLHAGIRALQKKKRAIIVAFDNRSREMHSDFNLPIIERDDIGSINRWIGGRSDVKMNIPEKSIARWKSQFGRTF